MIILCFILPFFCATISYQYRPIPYFNKNFSFSDNSIFCGGGVGKPAEIYVDEAGVAVVPQNFINLLNRNFINKAGVIGVDDANVQTEYIILPGKSPNYKIYNKSSDNIDYIISGQYIGLTCCTDCAGVATAVEALTGNVMDNRPIVELLNDVLRVIVKAAISK